MASKHISKTKSFKVTLAWLQTVSFQATVGLLCVARIDPKHIFSRTKKAFKLRRPNSKLFSFQATVLLLCEIKNAARINVNKLFPLMNCTTPEQKPHFHVSRTPATARTKQTVSFTSGMKIIS